MGAVEIVPDPTRIVASLSLSPTLLAVAVASVAIAILGMSLIGAFADRRVGVQSHLLAKTLNNMPQGVVMFDAAERLVICNDRYLEMYGLSPEAVKPGTRLIDIIRNRLKAGNLGRDPEQYRNELVAAMRAGKSVSFITESPDGRSISVVNRPIQGGGYWIGTHEDVTERLLAERQTTILGEQEVRRATVDAAIQSFRESVNELLRTVADSTAAMKSTATELSLSSAHTSDDASGAVHRSNEASENVETAATAA
jgi:PAS domain S-box-containing protein